jgi:hypothetical protein
MQANSGRIAAQIVVMTKMRDVKAGGSVAVARDFIESA